MNTDVSKVKYPNSASLFQFCRKVLDHKFGGIRVIDQDVGQILGFDPADCSHWKKGKKNIRSIQAMKSIADHLGVDNELVLLIASGEIDEYEGFQEYKGYGAFHLDQKLVEGAKKDFYRKHSGSWTRDKEQEFKQLFQINYDQIKNIVASIHEKIGFEEAPLYLPEIVVAYPNLSVQPGQMSLSETEEFHVRVTVDEGKTSIEYPPQDEMRPFMRFNIAKGMAGHFLGEVEVRRSELGDAADTIRSIEANVFAAELLTPEKLICKEIGSINVSKDLVTQLADVFWVSKAFMNRRLKDILRS